MTEYELADLAYSKQAEIHGLSNLLLSMLALIADNITHYMTVLFGYIAAAYFVGRDLKKTQLWVFSGLYIFWQLWTIALLVVRGAGVRLTNDRLEELMLGAPRQGDIPTGVDSWIGGSMVLALLAALAASLYFMWSVRHPKAE
jgi:hypothetical protein